MKSLWALIFLIGVGFGCKPVAKEGSDLLSPPDWTITGNWKSRQSCVYMSPSIYMNAWLVYSETTFTEIFEVYTDSKCNHHSYTKEITGTYTTSVSQISGGAVSGYINVDLTLVSYTMTPASTSAAVHLNHANFCGFNNWVKEVKKNVEGRTCSSKIIPNVGEIEFTIVQKYFSDHSVIYPPDMPLKPPDEFYYKGDLMLGTPSNNKNGQTSENRHDTILNNLAFLRF